MKLFESGKIGKMVIKNRIMMAPMGTGGLADPDGAFSRRLIDYYVARAKGGAGLIMPGCCAATMALEPLPLPLIDDGALTRLKRLCSEVHKYGAKIAIQLTPGFGRVNWPSPGLQPISASATWYFWDPSVTTRAITTEEVELLVRAFGSAAAIVKAAGADAIEIHGYGGYLLDQFQSALWNKRTDRYGGDLDGRLRFSMEIIEVTRRAVGEDFQLIYKFTPAHYIEGGRDIEEGLEVVRRLEKAGIDALHSDLGCYEVWYRQIPVMYEPPGDHVHLAEAVKKIAKIPVIVSGKLGDPELAAKVIEEGKADFIALGRPLLADPDWPRKVEEGRIDDVRPCIGDNEACMSFGGYTSCVVNPITGMEREYALTRAKKRKSVLVIGGGPGGLEAARVAAERGHKVVLWEKSAKLGGTLIFGSVPSFKQDLRRLIDYLSTQVRKLGVRIVFMKEATPDLVLEQNPDVVIIATGGKPLIPEVPGINGDNVSTALDVLSGKKEPGETVIVAGGGLVGCEVGVYLAQKGKRVTIIEMMGGLVPEGMGIGNKMALMNMIQESKVEVLTGTQLLGVIKEGAIVNAGGSKRELKADSIVLALGFEPDPGLRDALEGKVPELFAIGDCAERGNIWKAVWGGFHAARTI